MSLKEKIDQDLKTALKAGDTFRRSVLGMVKSAVHNKEIEKRVKDKGLSDEEVVAVISSEAKKRKDAAAEYKKAGREELAKKEEDELLILKDYLPEEMSEEKIVEELKKIVSETGAKSKQDLGRAMGEAMKRFAGKADGNMVRKELEKLLS